VVVATLIAPVIVDIASLNGLAVALVAVHLYVFYFGLIADVTPPVGLASFAASAISRADPVRTGVQAFRYEMRTAILPLIFIFNHQLLLIGVTNWAHLILVVLASLLGMLMFVSVTQQIFISRSRIWETALLLVAAAMLFLPGQFMDRLTDPTRDAPAVDIVELAEEAPPNAFLRVEVSGIDLSGNDYRRVVRLPLGEPGPGVERLANAGLQVAPLAGVYPALKLGPAWWFHDSPEGMRRFRELTTETAGFYNTVGFNDDTRAFPSIPARHDIARRVDCAFLARLVSEHRLREEEAFELATELAYTLAKKAYRL
jgi:hypothetical protein